MTSDPQPSRRRSQSVFWIAGAGLAALALVAVLVLATIDAARSGGRGGLIWLLSPDAGAASWTLASAATSEGVAIAIVIVVVVLGVQLSADRYSPRIIDVFIRDPLNLGVLALFLGSMIVTILTSSEIKANYVPRASVTAATVLAVVDFAVLLPYVVYLFDVMRAETIIDSIRKRARRNLGRAARAGADAVGHRHHLREALEQMTDIALGSIQEGDTEVCLAAIEQLRSLVVEDYLPVKQRLPNSWFAVDWVDMPGASDQVIEQVDRTGTWLEHSVLSDFVDLIGETPSFRKEVIHAIARSTRAIGEAALMHGDSHLEALVVRFFNTYLRAAMNQRAATLAYPTMNEYRTFALHARDRDPDLSLRVAEHLLAYGRSFDAAGMPFIVGTAAEDVAGMVQAVLPVDGDRAILLANLVARTLTEMAPVAQPIALNGVLKAVLKLALSALAEERADLLGPLLVAVAAVPEAFVTAALERMERTTEGVFWEVSDRVVAFDWVDQDLRALIPALRAKLEVRPGPPPGRTRRPKAPSAG